MKYFLQLVLIGALSGLCGPVQAQQTSLKHILENGRGEIIHFRDVPSTVKTGVIGKQDLIASVPYAYNKTIRLASDYQLNEGLRQLYRGTRGYLAGAYSMPGQTEQHEVNCLFAVPDKSGNIYAKPLCFLSNYKTMNGVFLGGQLPATNNIQTIYPNLPMPVSMPLIGWESEDIDHDFHLDIIFKRWFKNYQGITGADVYFKSEGQIVEEPFLAADSDGVVRLQLNDGVLALKIDPNDSQHVYADFSKTP